MSNSLVTVKFKDGTEMFTQYQGSSDTYYPALFKTADEAWSYNRHNAEDWKILFRQENLQEPEEVEIGGSWKAKACRKTMQLEVEYPEDWFG